MKLENFSNFVDKGAFGIWRYEKLFRTEYVKEKFNLEQEMSPLERREDLGEMFGIKNLYLKREDLNVLGSFKTRSLAYQISVYKSLGEKILVISSSGNAAICAARYCDLAQIKLICFISPDTDLGKKAILSQTKALIIESKKAMRLANYVSAKYKISNLRPSIDDLSLRGFESLAYEIYEQIENANLEARIGIRAFSFITSGSSFVGMYNGFKKLKDLGFLEQMPRMCGVVGERELESERRELEFARSKGVGALGVKKTRRMEEILKIAEETGGSIHEVSRADVDIVSRQCLDMSEQVSEESLAVLSVLQKEKNLENVIAIMSGRKWETSGSLKAFLRVESFEEADQIILNL